MKCRSLFELWLLLLLFSVCVNSLKNSHKAVTLSSIPLIKFNGTIRIGAPISSQLGDSFFSYGTAIANSWNMFVEWVNYEKGGVKIGEEIYSLSLYYLEDYSDSIYVTELCQILVDQGDLMAMFGPYSSILNGACVQITEPNEMLLLTSGTSDSTIFRNNKYFFGTLPPSVQYMT
jgi:ABC-type branched-subunit amino acid transport system substrate-binding protein